MIAYSRVFVNDLVKKANADGIERFVAGAVIVKDGSALILQRARADFMGGLYEIPSGGVEEGESIEDALARETLEETGLKISGILYYVSSFTITAPSTNLSISSALAFLIRSFTKTLL